MDGWQRANGRHPLLFEQGGSTLSVSILDGYTRARAGCLGTERVSILRLRRRSPPPPPRVPAALAAARFGSVPRRGRNDGPRAGRAGSLDPMPGPSAEERWLGAQDRGPVSFYDFAPSVRLRHRLGISRHGPRWTRGGEERRFECEADRATRAPVDATRIAGSYCERSLAQPPAGGFSSLADDHADRPVLEPSPRSGRVGTVRGLTHYSGLAHPGPCGVISKASAVGRSA